MGATNADTWAGRSIKELVPDSVNVFVESRQCVLLRPHTNVLLLPLASHGLIAILPPGLSDNNNNVDQRGSRCSCPSFQLTLSTISGTCLALPCLVGTASPRENALLKTQSILQTECTRCAARRRRSIGGTWRVIRFRSARKVTLLSRAASDEYRYSSQSSGQSMGRWHCERVVAVADRDGEREKRGRVREKESERGGEMSVKRVYQDMKKKNG